MSVLELALKALMQPGNTTLWHQAVHALRNELEKKQEPVAWLQPKTVDAYSRPDLGFETCSKDDYGAFPVYTTPPCREWRSLSEKEIRRMGIETPGQQGGWNLAFARAIEAALKEKNHE
jgi:hypothetical protein